MNATSLGQFICECEDNFTKCETYHQSSEFHNKSVSLLTMLVFQVVLLKKYPCSKCGLNMEITTDQASVPCTRCGTEVVRQDQASSDNGDSVETK